MNWIEHSVLAVTRTTDLAPSYAPPPDASGSIWVWIVAGGFTAIALGVGFWFTTQRSADALNVSDDITLELCRAHHVGLQHRFVLESIASRAKLAHTAELFLSPQLFDDAVAKANRKKRIGMRQRTLLFEARQCLFG